MWGSIVSGALKLFNGVVSLIDKFATWGHDAQMKEEGRELEKGQSASETLEGVANVREFRDGLDANPADADKLRSELERK